jgi:DNA gyrase subunit A
MIPKPEGRVLTVSENGYGKRTAIDEFPVKGRGTRGVIGMQTSERNGQLVGAIQVTTGDQMMLISDQGTLVRCRTDEVSELGRNTQGVRAIRLKEGESLMNVARIDEPEEEDLVIDAESESAVESESTVASEANASEAASDEVKSDTPSADDSASEE